MGNRLQKIDSGAGTQTNTFDAANRLTSVNGQAYTNDLDGNTLTGGGRTNTWDLQNRLTQCVYNNQTSSYVYGSDGLRHRSVTGTAANPITTDYALDGQNVVQEMRAVSGTLTPIATYLTGPSGPMYKRSADGIIRWYVYDGLGSVVGEVDPNGVMTARRGFDVYGATRSSSGTPTSKHGFVGGLGHPTEDDTGLIYMRARWYDPGVGRFVSQDPAKDGANWFSYVDNNPVNYGDASGNAKSLPWALTWWTVGMGFALLSFMLFMQNASDWVSPALRARVVTAFALGAVLSFGLAAIGMDSLPAEIIGVLTPVVVAMSEGYLVVVGKELEAASGVPYVRAAVAAAYIEGLVLLGYCASIGVDA